MRNLAILGSTGSIGTNALKIVAANPDRYRVTALGAGTNLTRLLGQIETFHPRVVAVQDARLAQELSARIPAGGRPEILAGTEGFIRLSTLDGVDTVVSAMTGAAGLVPTYEAVRAGKTVALANKETMVMAGPLIMAEAESRNVAVIPIDSEHSAILQSLQVHSRMDVRRVILTASGGPFREMPVEAMREVTPEAALRHPNWSMGPKVTIDSATLMNKGLEAIEAKWLFGLEMDQISILIHPQSIVHSMVEYKDGSIIAQMGIPDMITPIAYALAYPRHIENALPALDLEAIGVLTFRKPDLGRFRCLELALRAAETGGSMPTVLNGANEIAVASFLAGNIPFLGIADLIERTMAEHRATAGDTLDEIMAADRWARTKARDLLETGG
jgi:1-deoxy-D-xylulose-5-phosphate reductoisomerase